MTKTIVRSYDDLSTAREAVEDLVRAGFDGKTISLIARDADGQFATHFQKQAAQGEQGPPDGEEEGAMTGGLIGGLAGILLGLGCEGIGNKPPQFQR